MAGIGPEDIDLAQLQDTEAGAEIMHMAENGFCEHGEQEQMIQNGETEIGGRFPVNTDGGCLANGEPIGASGLRQVYENVLQLRGDAGKRQVPERAEDCVHARLRRSRHLRRHDPRSLTCVQSDALQQLLDRQEITDVIHAYCRNVDLVNPAAIAALFTDDCTVDYGPGLGTPTSGARELEERLGRGLPRFAATSHHVSNIEITFSGDGASATTITYLYAWHRHPGDEPDAHLWARYHDQFVRTADGWRIRERVLKVAGQENFDVEWHPIGRSQGNGRSS